MLCARGRKRDFHNLDNAVRCMQEAECRARDCYRYLHLATTHPKYFGTVDLAEHCFRIRISDLFAISNNHFQPARTVSCRNLLKNPSVKLLCGEATGPSCLLTMNKQTQTQDMAMHYLVSFVNRDQYSRSPCAQSHPKITHFIKLWDGCDYPAIILLLS